MMRSIRRAIKLMTPSRHWCWAWEEHGTLGLGFHLRRVLPGEGEFLLQIDLLFGHVIFDWDFLREDLDD